MTWGYRKNGITKEFAEMDDLMDFLEKCDREASFQLRYWHVDENFDDYDLKYSLILGEFVNLTERDWLEDALWAVQDAFENSGLYDWREDTKMGVYYREEESE